MKHQLIDEFCKAIENWAEITNQAAENVTFYAMIHLGAPWFVRPEGAVENPDSPEHRNKTVGEVMGRYTTAQLRDYLIHMVDDLKVFEDFLIIGLARSIEAEFSELVLDYDEAINRTIEEAKKFQGIYDHPDENEELLELLQKSLTQKFGEEADAKEVVLHVASGFWKMSHRKPDDLAQLHSMLAAWKTVVAPVIARENTKKWRKTYMNSFGGEYGK